MTIFICKLPSNPGLQKSGWLHKWEEWGTKPCYHDKTSLSTDESNILPWTVTRTSEKWTHNKDPEFWLHRKTYNHKLHQMHTTKYEKYMILGTGGGVPLHPEGSYMQYHTVKFHAKKFHMFSLLPPPPKKKNIPPPWLKSPCLGLHTGIQNKVCI
jgi:hypothetical protein